MHKATTDERNTYTEAQKKEGIYTRCERRKEKKIDRKALKLACGRGTCGQLRSPCSEINYDVFHCLVNLLSVT